MKKTLITSALPYANGYLHLGHCAGAYLPADIYARYKRLKGEELLYVCGSDEHGVAITIAAEKEKIPPKEIIDKYHFANKEAFEKFGMTFDIYSRTSKQIHHATAQEFFKDFLNKGHLVDLEEEQYYDEDAKMFLPDRYVEGVCPNCGNEHARGDQCDSCGAYYNQLDLKDPISLVSGKKPIVRKTVHWYMRFDKFQDFLQNYIESHSGEWKENVLQQTRSWLKRGMSERAITRDLSWGVKVDEIAGVPIDKANGKVLYVWFEAVLGYISATKQLMDELRKESTEQLEIKVAEYDWRSWWQNPDTRYIAFIGKDNIVFHTLIFPAMLQARGENYILPDNVPANEFLNLEGQKFSKSRNWSIDLRDFQRDFPNEEHTDALRYSLVMSLPETRDSDFTWKDFQTRNNSELAAIFGNFVNRTMQFIQKNFESKVPVLPDKYRWINIYWKNLLEYLYYSGGCSERVIRETPEELQKLLNLNDVQLICTLWQGIKLVSKHYEQFRFRDAATETMNIARAANKYFNDEEPWKSIKSDPALCAKTLFVCSQLVNALSILFAPIVPHACKKIQESFELENNTGESIRGIFSQENVWEKTVYPLLKDGTEINIPGLLFPIIEDELIKIQMEKLGKTMEEKIEKAKEKKLITIDDFMQTKLRTAKVIEAEKLPKSKKLLKLLVDIGEEKKQILAGIAEHYEPEQLIGKTVIVVANLQPAKLMGVESQGMLLAANTADGKLSVVTVDNPEIEAGAEVR